MIKRIDYDLESAIKKCYIKWIKDDVYFACIFLALSLASVILFSVTDTTIFKALNLFNCIIAFCIFIKNIKNFIDDLDELADIKTTSNLETMRGE